MTDDTAAGRQQLVPTPRPEVGNPWLGWLGFLGFALLAVAAIVLLVPPTATDQLDGSSIVNFPSLYRQYAFALLAGIAGASFLVAWGVAGASDWRLKHTS